MRLEITQLQQQLATTAVYVTHDQVEAMTMADRIVVLNAGRIEQFGSPLELYDRPANLFVAGFIGSPQDEFRHRRAGRRHGATTIGIRPEHLRIARDGEGEAGRARSRRRASRQRHLPLCRCRRAGACSRRAASAKSI